MPASILMLLALACAGTSGAGPKIATPPDGKGFEQAILSIHNRERSLVGVADLEWDPVLAASAAAYGPELERIGRLVHSPRADRSGQRENLARDYSWRSSPETLAQSWIDEKRNFLPGSFPAVSRTGHWKDVAHYTQMIWAGTSRMGCALHQGLEWSYLICRYSPPGNTDGTRVP